MKLADLWHQTAKAPRVGDRRFPRWEGRDAWDDLAVESEGQGRPTDEWSKLSDELFEAETGRSWRRVLLGRRLAGHPTRRTVFGATVGLGGLAVGTAILPVAWPLGIAIMVGSQVIAFRIYREDARFTTQISGESDYEPSGESDA